MLQLVKCAEPFVEYRCLGCIANMGSQTSQCYYHLYRLYSTHARLHKSLAEKMVTGDNF